MKRLSIIFIVFAVSVSSALAFAAYRWWGDAVREGSRLHTVRILDDKAKRRFPKLPLVAWVGDSTIMRGTSEIPPYPVVIRDRLRAAKTPIESVEMAHGGVGPFVEYCAVGKLIPLEPKALLIIANLRALTRSRKERGVLEIASFIPSDELIRAAFLPWHFAEITIPRLFLARTLTWPHVERLFHFTEGLRQMFRDELYTSTRRRTFMDRVRANRRGLEQYRIPIDEWSPQVVMLRAAVDLAVRSGIRTTVIMTPIQARVFEVDDDSASLFAERSEMVRRVVRSAGGRYLDLHDALPAELFRDLGGHFTAEGTEYVATLVEPFVREDVFELPSRR